MEKLDLGCGYRKREGFIGVDKSPVSDATVICSLEHPLPFCDEVFNEVWGNQILEHIHALIQLMNEISRVTKSGARIEFRVPYYKSEHAFRDPTHVRYFTEKTFYCFDATTTWFKANARLYGISCRMKVISLDVGKDVIKVVFIRS